MPVSPRVELGHRGLLTWARESAGYEIADAARLLNTSEEEVARWEEGSDSPRYKQLERLANKYKRPLAAFFLPGVPKEPPRPADFRTIPRRQSGEYEPESLLAFREARNWLADTRELLELLEVDLRLSLPALRLTFPHDEAAARVRSLLGITFEDQIGWRQDFRGVCDSWRDVLFDHGVVTLVFKMPFKDVRAFSTIGHDLGGIGLNSKDRKYGRVFSLFHEVGHLCLRQPGVSGALRAGPSRRPTEGRRSVEEYCDDFAASFLMPAEHPEVQKALGVVRQDQSRDRVEEVANRLKVSKYAVLRRARDLGYVSQRTYSDVFQVWAEEDASLPRPSGGGNHVYTRVSHVGKRLTSVVLEALDSRQITPYRASRLLGIEPRHFGRARELSFAGGRHAR